MPFPRLIWKILDIRRDPWRPKRRHTKHIFQKSKKEDPGCYKLWKLSLVPGKSVEHVLLEYAFKYGKNKNVIRSNQHESTKAKSCLTKLNAFDDELTASVDELRAVDAVYTLTSPKLLRWTPRAVSWSWGCMAWRANSEGSWIGWIKGQQLLANLLGWSLLCQKKVWVNSFCMF